MYFLSLQLHASFSKPLLAAHIAGSGESGTAKRKLRKSRRSKPASTIASAEPHSTAGDPTQSADVATGKLAELRHEGDGLAAAAVRAAKVPEVLSPDEGYVSAVDSLASAASGMLGGAPILAAMQARSPVGLRHLKACGLCQCTTQSIVKGFRVRVRV